MLKKIFFVVLVTFVTNQTFSQILYSERFNNLTLNTGTYTANGSTQNYLYSAVSNSLTAINNGDKIADTLTGNYPFRANGQKKIAWLAYRPAAITNTTDTFAVSSSWLNPIGTADAWLITPTISTITVNSVLSWQAMAPDVINADGYEVYVTTDTSGAPITTDFSTLLFTTSAESNAWRSHGVSLAQYAGQSIRIAFKNNSTNKYQLWLDDIVVENISNAFDAAAISQEVYKYSVIGANNTITATFKNKGYAPINNMTINYKVGNSAAVTETITLLSAINYLDTKQLSFSMPFNSGTADYYTFKIWVSEVNGQPDQLMNDTISGAITLSNSVPAKKILIEEFTGATYGWAPDSYTKLSAIVSTNSNVIATSIHKNDNMSIPEGTTLASDYAQDFPSASIDQYYYSGKNRVALEDHDWNASITQRQNMRVPATVTISAFTYDTISRQINATVAANFVGDVKGDYRLNLYVKENHVYGPLNDNTDNGWNQYSFLHNIPTSPYYQLGTYLNTDTYLMNGQDYKHQYVVNHIAGGSYGSAGIIPLNGTTSGNTYTMSYSYVLPMPSGSNEYRYNANNIYLVGMVTEFNADPNMRAVLNVCETKLNSKPETPVGLKDLAITDFKLSVYPNPASEYCILNYELAEPQNVSVSIYNALGELTYIETLNTNPGTVSHRLNLNYLPQGNYTIVVSLKNNSITKKLTIIK